MMKSKTSLKITLDVVMTVMFIVLLDAFSTGLVFHEIAGLAIFALFLTHITLNWSWVKNVSKNLLSPGFKTKPKFMYALNLTLLVGVSAIIITGILISRVIFDFGVNGHSNILVAVHKWTSYALLGLFAVHIALHWRYIMISVRNMFSGLAGRRLRRTIETLGAAALVLVVLYSVILPGEDKAAQSVTPPQASPYAARKTDPGGDKGIYEYKTKNDQNDTILEDSHTETAASVSLSEYLGKMFCTGCSKHCPLLSPRCEIGNSQLQTAKIQYQELYGETTK